MTLRSPAAAVLALALAGCVAQGGGLSGDSAPRAYRATNTMDVVAVDGRPATVAVLSQARAGPSDYWCAAGDYAARFLASPTDRLYALGRAGPQTPGRRAFLFTTAPGPELAEGRRPGDGGDYSLKLDEPGFSIRVAQARGYCLDSRRKFLSPGLL